MRPWHRLLALFTLAFTLNCTTLAQSPSLREVLPKIPADTNALILIDVQALHQSALGRQEKWAKRHDADFLAGRVPFPPGTSLVALATCLEVDPAGAQRSWELGLVSLTRPVSALLLADLEQGILETVAGQQVVLTPRQLYFAPLSNRLVGVLAPAERQELSRWLHFCQRNKSPVISDWLRSASAGLSRDQPLLLAIHLEDAVDPRQVRRHLGLAQAALPPGTDLDGLAQLLASAKGLRLALQVKDEIRGELRIEFNKPVKPFEHLLHVVLAFGVKTLGDGLPDLKGWTMEIKDQTVIFQRGITPKEFAHLLESIQPQTSLAGLGATEGKNGPGDKAFTARRYFQQVSMLTTELNQRTAKMSDYDLAAMTYQNYAQRLDRLSVYGVDEELVKYGNSVSNKLRVIAESLGGVPISAAYLESARQEVFLYRPARFVNSAFWWPRRTPHSVWGGAVYLPEWFYYDTNLPELRSKLAQVIAKDQENRLNLWRTIDEDTARIRKKLSAKYGVEF